MAGSEIYRVEIPIIVDDQSDAPLRQAEERVSRFQRTAEKRTKMAREHMMALAKMKIEPVMRIKDQLTNSVVNADRLIKKLGMEEASPLIEAQDRASAVVARVDAALQAVDRGDVKVIAEMQGPLMDEIAKAKASLKALEGVRAGPVAELRGELFGQLTRAFTEAKKLDRLMVEPRATLRERVTSKVREIGVGLRGLTSRAWTIAINVKEKVVGVVGRIGRILTSPLALLGMGGGAVGLGALIKDFVMTAGRTETLNIAMESVAKSTGTAMDKLLSAREAVMGLGIAEQEATLVMTRFMQGQLDIAQAAKIARVAQDAAVIAGTDSSEATETIVESISKLRPELLSQFGMTKNLNDIYADYADQLGIVVKTTDKYGKTVRHMTRDMADAEKKQAMVNYVIAEGAKLAGTYEASMGAAFKKLGSLTRYWTDFKTKVGAPLFLAAFGSVIDGLTDAFKSGIEWAERSQDTIEQWGRNIADTLDGAMGQLADIGRSIIFGPEAAMFARQLQVRVDAEHSAAEEASRLIREQLAQAWALPETAIPGIATILGSVKMVGEDRLQQHLASFAGKSREQVEKLLTVYEKVSAEIESIVGKTPDVLLPDIKGGKGWSKFYQAWEQIGGGSTLTAIQLQQVMGNVGDIMPQARELNAIEKAWDALQGKLLKMGKTYAGLTVPGLWDLIPELKLEPESTKIIKEELEQLLRMTPVQLKRLGIDHNSVDSVTIRQLERALEHRAELERLTVPLLGDIAPYLDMDELAALADKIEQRGELRARFETVWQTMIWDPLITTMKDNTPEIAEAALGLGKEIGGGIVSGIYEMIKSDPWAGMLIGGFIGFKLGGAGGILPGIIGGAALWGAPKAFDAFESVWGPAEEAIEKQLEKQGTLYPQKLPHEMIEDAIEKQKIEEHLKKYPHLREHATGGILTRPHLGLVAEAGPEAIIPLTKPARAWELWQNVGERMGFFSREKVDYAIPTKIAQQRLTLSASGMGADRPTSVLTRGMSEPLEKLETETRRITTRGYEAINRIKSVVEWVKRVAHTADFYTTAGDFSGTSAGPAGYMPLVTAAAAKFNIPAGLLSRLVQAESSWRPGIVSHAGAIGLTQVMPDTARGMGYSVEALRRSPEIQIEAGAKYLAQQYNRFGSWPLALAAYNAGPGAVSKHGGIPPYRETQNYVAKILSPKAYARGGILTRPHIGMVAENGPEAIIPLSTGMRPRALKLWAETGKMLGAEARGRTNVISLSEHRNIKAYASGGFTGAVLSLPVAAGGWDVPISDPKQAVPRVANINLNFDLAGLVGQVVIENKDDIDGAVDKITGAIANNLRSVFQNMTK